MADMAPISGNESEDEESSVTADDSAESEDSSDWTSSSDDEVDAGEKPGKSGNSTDSAAHACKIAFVAERDAMPTDIKFHDEKNLCVSADMDGHVTMWKINEERNTADLVVDVVPHQSPCRAIHFLKSSSKVISVGKDKRICLIDNARIERTIKKAHEASVYCVKCLTENTFSTGDDDGHIKIWDTRTNEAVMDFKDNDEYISAMQCDSDGKTLLATSGDGTLSAFNVRRKKLELQSEAFPTELLSICLVKGGSKVICGSGDGSLLMFKWGEWGYTLDQYPSGTPMSIDAVEQFSADRVFTATSDGSIRLLNIMPYRMLGYAGSHTLPFERMSLSPQKDLLASTSHDNTIRFWNVSKFLEVPDIESGSDSDSDEDTKKNDADKKRGRNSTKMPKRPKPARNDFFDDM